MLCRVNDVVKIPFANPRARVSLRGDLSACSHDTSNGTLTFHKPGRVEATVQSGGDMWQGEFIAEGEAVAVEQPVEQPTEQPVEQPTEQPADVAEVIEEKAEEAQEPEHSEEDPAPGFRRVGRFDRYTR